MTDGQLYSAMLEALRQAGVWLTFDELEQAIPWDATDEKKYSEPRRARLRGAVGRAIHAGHILRTAKGQAKYAIAPAIEQTADLFEEKSSTDTANCSASSREGAHDA